MTTDVKKYDEQIDIAMKLIHQPEKDVDYDPFDFNPREHDLWLAINALRFIVKQNYIPDHEWRLKEVANLLENELEQ